jgi:acyl-CoA synthetase (AMP-forming)/AMP-acid ligase II
VAPREVEVALESLPEVQHAHVVGIPDKERGQFVVAAVALHEGVDATPEELRERLRDELSSYKLPRHVLLFEARSLPLLDSGKIDKRSLQVAVSERLEHAAAS